MVLNWCSWEFEVNLTSGLNITRFFGSLIFTDVDNFMGGSFQESIQI